MEATSWIALGGVVLAFVTAVFGGIWKQSNVITQQFSELKDLINDKISSVLTKLEYHEKHDDQRFNRISDDIWMMRLMLNVPPNNPDFEKRPSKREILEDVPTQRPGPQQFPL